MSPAAPSPPAPAPALAVDGIDVSRLRLAIVRIARRQRQQAGIGLTPSLQSALATVDIRGPLTVGELAGAEAISAPSTTRIVTKLEDLGLVERRPHPDDGRCTTVAITASGRTQLAESRERRETWLREAIARLGADDIAALAQAIEPLERLFSQLPDTQLPDTQAPDTQVPDVPGRPAGGAG